jgi:hypothetical protein
MIISNDEIRKSLAYMASKRPAVGRLRAAVTPEQLVQIKEHLQGLPEVRQDVVDRIRSQMCTYELDPREIADKMVGRAIADSLI